MIYLKTIQLTRGKVALVDDTDYDWLMRWKWCARPVQWKDSPKIIWYACRRKRRGESERRVGNIDMHVALLGLCPRGCWDHKDGDGLNNQRSNLRPATGTLNNGNHKTLARNNTSGFKGVCWKNGAWEATIYKNNRGVYLGRFRDPKDAARKYDTEALEYFGAFAVTNAALNLL